MHVQVYLSQISFLKSFLCPHSVRLVAIIVYFTNSQRAVMCRLLLYIHSTMSDKWQFNNSSSGWLRYRFKMRLSKAPFRLRASARVPCSGTKMDVVQTRQCLELNMLLHTQLGKGTNHYSFWSDCRIPCSSSYTVQPATRLLGYTILIYS